MFIGNSPCPITGYYQYSWILTNPYDREERYVLYVTSGDTLNYILFRTKSSYGVRTQIKGYVIPNLSEGYCTNPFGESCEWGITNYGAQLEVDLGDFMYIGFNLAIHDTLNGGGSLKWDPGWPETKWEAQWYGNGHGRWATASGESGEW